MRSPNRILAEEMACLMMREILYDNGCVNRLESEKSHNKRNARHLVGITDAIEKFVRMNSDFEFTEDVFKEIATGGYTESNDALILEAYPSIPSLPGWENLDLVLIKYFEGI